jgi:hypothetical protein
MKKIILKPKRGGKTIVMTPKKKPVIEITKKSKSVGPQWKKYA